MMHFLVDFSGIKEARRQAACTLILASSMGQEMEFGSGKHTHPGYLALDKLTVGSFCLPLCSVGR